MHTSSAASGSSTGNVSGIEEGSRAPQGLLDTLSDTFLNAFAKVRKPDERFEAMKERLEKFEEGLAGVERVVGRGRVRWTGEFSSSRSKGFRSLHRRSCASQFSAICVPTPHLTH